MTLSQINFLKKAGAKKASVKKASVKKDGLIGCQDLQKSENKQHQDLRQSQKQQKNKKLANALRQNLIRRKIKTEKN
jgi:hypothetical protein